MKNLQTLLIASIILLIIGLSCLGLMSTVNYYSPQLLANATKDYQSLNATLTKIYSGINETSTQINRSLGSEIEEGTWGFFDSLIKTVTVSLKTVAKSFTFLTNFMFKISDYLPIPNWVGSLLATIIILLIGFAIWKAIFKVS